MLAKDCKRKVILTGDRPTGKLHLGHFVGSLQRRVQLQNSGQFDEMFVFIADAQALTDNFDNPEKVRQNIIEVALDYLSVGLDPDKVTIFIQSMIPELTELTFYYMNLVTTQRLSRNPTVKSEMLMRGFNGSESEDDNVAGLPAGFFTYPVSQTADITAFKATTVPAGEDQMPMIEQAREIAHRFNTIYKCDVLVEPDILIPENAAQRRLPGIDGKSLGNGIFLSDDAATVKKKVMSMYTDPTHINVADPGHVEGNMVFTYLDAFLRDDSQFADYLPDYKNLEEMKEHYQRGGLGDMKCKKFLLKVMEDMLQPIRENRAKWETNINDVYDILKAGTDHAVQVTNQTLHECREAMQINYFDDKDAMVKSWEPYEELMGTWKSRGLRGSQLEELINRTNEAYLEKKLAVVQKIPTPITPINMNEDHTQITLAYFDQKSTVDYIGLVQGIPVCFDAKECATNFWPLQNLHPHQVRFMQAFEEQGGISFIILSFTTRKEMYYIPFRDIQYFWNRMQNGGKKSFNIQEIDLNYRIRSHKDMFVHYLEPLQRDLDERDRAGSAEEDGADIP